MKHPLLYPDIPILWVTQSVLKVPPPPLSTDQSFTGKLRSDHQVVGGQVSVSMGFLKGRFQKLRSDHLVVGAQGGRWTREGGSSSLLQRFQATIVLQGGFGDPNLL